MLTKSTVIASYPLASQIAGRKLALIAKPNTVLYELKRALDPLALSSSVIQNMNAAEGYDIDSYAKFIDHLTTGQDTPTQHDVVMDGFVHDIGKSVAAHLAYARSTVKPIVIEFCEKVWGRIENFQQPSAENEFTITYVNVPDPLLDALFFNKLETYKDEKIAIPFTPAEFKVLNAEDVLENILFGEKNIDEAITTWFSKIDAKEAASFLNKVLGHIPSLETAFPSLNMNIGNIDNALLLFLFSQRASNQPEDFLPDDHKTDSVAIKNIKKSINEHLVFAGALVYKLFKQMEMFEKAGQLVVSLYKKEITVLGPVFRTWLQNGGKTEQLLGLACANLPYRNVKAINEVNERLAKEWRDYELFFNSTQSNQRLTVMKTILSEVFAEVVKPLYEVENSQQVGSYSTCFNKLEMILNRLKLSDLNDINKLGLKIICRTCFCHTEAEFILTEIEEIAKANPNLDIQEAAMLATVNYIVDYLFCQVDLTSKI